MNIEDLITNLYEVYTTVTDGVEGKLVGVFSTYESAYNAAKGKGWYGTSGIIKPAKGFIINDKAFVLKYEPVIMDTDIVEEKQKEIDIILDKLTPEEIEKLKINRDSLKKDMQPVESPILPFNIPA